MIDTPKQQEIEQLAKDLAYIERRVFTKEYHIKLLMSTNKSDSEDSFYLQELEKLGVLYTRRSILKKQLEDL